MNNINQNAFIMHFPGIYRCFMADTLQMYLDGDFSAGKLRSRYFKNKLETNNTENKPWYFGIEGKWWWGMNEEQFLERVKDDNFSI